MCGEPKQALLPACPCGVEEFCCSSTLLVLGLLGNLEVNCKEGGRGGGKDIIDYLSLPVVKCHFQQQTKLQLVYDPVKVHLPVFI